MKKRVLINIKNITNGRCSNNDTKNFEWENKVFNELSCEELLFIEINRELMDDPTQIVKEIMKNKGCDILNIFYENERKKSK